MMNENAENNGQNIGSDHDDLGEAMTNKREDLVNFLQNNATLSFGNVEEMCEEENAMIKSIKITEPNLDEEVNGCRKKSRLQTKPKKICCERNLVQKNTTINTTRETYPHLGTKETWGIKKKEKYKVMLQIQSQEERIKCNF